MDRAGFHIVARNRRGLLRDLAAAVADAGGDIDATHLSTGSDAELYIEAVGVGQPEGLLRALETIEGVLQAKQTETAGQVFGKRVIVIGGGAQVSQVVMGAVSEADRHNIRGERISVDTIPLVGERPLAEAVRAVARLPRAKILVLAGSLMGGEVTKAVIELRVQHRVPVISLAMVGSVPAAADLVVSDPVQAGVIAVMAIADTASFDLGRVQGRRL